MSMTIPRNRSMDATRAGGTGVDSILDI